MSMTLLTNKKGKHVYLRSEINFCSAEMSIRADKLSRLGDWTFGICRTKKRCHDSISSAHLHKCIYSFVYFHDALHAQTTYHCYTYYYRPISTSLLSWLITCQPSYFLRIFNLVPYLGWVDLGTMPDVK